MEDAQTAMEEWMGWWGYYYETKSLGGDEKDFFIEEVDQNDYMNELTKKLNEYDRKKRAYDAMKERYKTDLKRPEYPLTRGQSMAWRVLYWNERDEPNFEDFVWDKNEAKDFIDTLRAAGVKTFTVTNQSTALMENMHWFEQNGCKLMGLCEVEETDEWNRKHYGNKMGVRFAL